MNKTIILHIILDKLQSFYGSQRWWPADTPFEVMLGAVLTQNTAWSNVEKAIEGLREFSDLTPEAILSLTGAQLEKAIRSSGYFRQKALRLQHLCGYLMEKYCGNVSKMEGTSTDKLREELLGLHGIGPETADSILLYALGRPVFVVDAYTVRLCSRLELIKNNSKYHEAQDMFMKNLDLDPAMYNEYHALIVRHCKKRCFKNHPLCQGCPMEDLCGYNLKSHTSDLKIQPTPL